MSNKTNEYSSFTLLKTGSLIIGYFSLVGLLTLIMVTILLMVSGHLRVAQNRDLEEHMHIETFETIWILLTGIILLVEAVDLIFVICLIVGIHKDKRECVKAYLIYTATVILFSVFLLAFYLLPNITIITIGFRIFFLAVVRGYYMRMYTFGITKCRTARDSVGA